MGHTSFMHRPRCPKIAEGKHLSCPTFDISGNHEGFHWQCSVCDHRWNTSAPTPPEPEPDVSPPTLKT